MDLADGLTLSAKQEKQLESAVTIVSAIAAWEFQATEKFDHGVSLISKQRFGDALAQTFGKNVAQKIFPNVSIQGVQTLNPSAVINSTNLAGIGLLIADKIADEFIGSEYRKMDGLQPIVRGTAKGLIVGGTIGGLVDATYGTTTPNPGYASAFPRGPAFDGSSRVNQLNR